MDLSLCATHALTFYHKHAKFLLAIGLLLLCLCSIIHVDYTLLTLVANLTNGGVIRRVIQDAVLSPDRQVCNQTLNLVARDGTVDSYDSIVIIATHP